MNKIKNSKGFTMIELLVSTLIVVLVSIGLAAGVALANRQFIKMNRYSEAQELYSTLNTLLTNELRYTNSVVIKNGNVDSFFSVTYALKNERTSLVVLDEDGNETLLDYGQLALGNNGQYNRLVGSASYTSYNLGAKAVVTYDADKKLFTVDLDIGEVGGDSIVRDTFNVRAMNTVSVEG